MNNESLVKIALESPEYHKLSLEDKIRVFNREVQAFEQEQHQKILTLWQTIQNDYIKPGKLTKDNVEALNNSFTQALANLKGMMQAQTLYEAELYRKSYIAVLERVKAPSRRRKFIMLQTESIGLAHDAHDVQSRIAIVKKELNNLKSQYEPEHQGMFRRAERELTELAQIKDPALFTHKRKQYLNTLADIHESANALSSAQRECNDHVEEAMDRGQALFNARSSYLEDKNSWMNRAAGIAEKSWVGLGTGLAVVPVALIIAGAVIGGAVLAPAAAVIGIAAAAYGIVDFARTTATTITGEITPKLGDKSFEKPKLSTWQKVKKVAKKALPIALCVAGAAIAVAAVVLTAGIAAIALAGAGLAVAAAGVGVMVNDKYNEYKEVQEIQSKHKETNEQFESADESLTNENAPTPTPQDELTDSTEESMSILAGHELTQQDVDDMEVELKEKKDETDVSPVTEIPEDDDEGEGESEAKTETDEESGSEEEPGDESSSNEDSGDAPTFRP